MVRQVIKETGVVFQLGHQGRQTDCYQKAEEIIGNGLLGPVNLIEVCTNRNSPNGAWVYDIIEILIRLIGSSSRVILSVLRNIWII